MKKLNWRDDNFHKRDVVIPRVLLGAKIAAGVVMFLLYINIVPPLVLRKENFYVYRNKCIGAEINDVCIGLALYDRTLVGP